MPLQRFIVGCMKLGIGSNSKVCFPLIQIYRDHPSASVHKHILLTELCSFLFITNIEEVFTAIPYNMPVC